MAESAIERRQHEADRDALVEATSETLEMYAQLAHSYADSIDRQRDLLEGVDDTLRKVRQILAES